MSTSMRVSEKTKRKLEAVKRPDKTFNKLLACFGVDRTETDVQRLAGFGEEGIETHMQTTRAELNESLDERGQQLDGQ